MTLSAMVTSCASIHSFDSNGFRVQNSEKLSPSQILGQVQSGIKKDSGADGEEPANVTSSYRYFSALGIFCTALIDENEEVIGRSCEL